MKVTMAEANLVYAAAGDDHASSTAANEHTRKALEAFLAARALSGPFVLSEREHEEVYQARLETNPDLYPDSRTAILTGAIERAVRTLGPASGQWSEVVVDRPPVTQIDELDARRYRRLQVLGCAPYGSTNLESGTVQRFSNLDAFVDADIKGHPSRGEAVQTPPSGQASSVGGKPDEPYKQGFSDGFTRGIEYGRALAQLGKP
jgi:hypothetical protein